MALRRRLSPVLLLSIAKDGCRGQARRGLARSRLPPGAVSSCPTRKQRRMRLRAVIGPEILFGALTPVRRPGCLRQSSGLLAAVMRQTRWLCVPALRPVCPCRGRRRPYRRVMPDAWKGDGRRFCWSGPCENACLLRSNLFTALLAVHLGALWGAARTRPRVPWERQYWKISNNPGRTWPWFAEWFKVLHAC